MRTPLLLAILLSTSLLPAAVPAQESDEEWLERCRRDHGWNDDRERFCEVREYGFRPAGERISVDAGQNGGVSIRGWERDSVAVTARIQVNSSSMSRARDMAREIEVQAGRSGIGTRGPSMRASTHWSVSFVIYVPRRSSLRAETHNGPIGVSEVTGDMSLRAVNGPLSLSGVGGDVRARTQNGPLTVDLEGDHWEGAGLDAETQNGPVTLSIPDGYSALLETGTVNGPMRFNFPITVEGNLRRRITATLGKGGASVRVVTTNGPLVVRRG